MISSFRQVYPKTLSVYRLGNGTALIGTCAVRRKTVAGHGEPSEIWQPLVMKYMSDPHTEDYPDYASLLSFVKRHFNELELQYIAQLLCDVTHRKISYSAGVFKYLTARIKKERPRCSGLDLLAIAELCKLVANDSVCALSDVVLEAAVDRQLDLSPAVRCGLVWRLRYHVENHFPPGKTLSNEVYLLDAIAPNVLPLDAFRLLSVCHAGLSLRSIEWSTSVIRSLWFSDKNEDLKLETFLAFLRLSQTPQFCTSASVRSLVAAFVPDLKKMSTNVHVLAVMVVALGNLLGYASDEVVSIAMFCIDRLLDVPAECLQPLLVSLCMPQTNIHRDRVLQAVSQALTSAHGAMDSDSWLVSLYQALLLVDAHESSLAASLAADACHRVAHWDTASRLWQDLARLLFSSGFIDTRLSSAVLARLSKFEHHDLLTIGGLMYWLWSAAVLDLDLPERFHSVLSENPIRPCFRKDSTLFLMHELQWLFGKPCLQVFSFTDPKDIQSSRLAARSVTDAFGRRAPLFCVQLLASRPFICVAFLLNNKRKMIRWEDRALSVNAIDKKMLAEQGLHAVAVVVMDHGSSTVSSNSTQRRSKQAWTVWRATVEARGWQVIELSKDNICAQPTNLEIRHLVCRMATIH